jgi:H+/Cl- antiporter ClcA
VHVSAIVATITERFLPEYKKFASSVYDQRELLATACAVGVSSTFGAPFGGKKLIICTTGYKIGSCVAF